MPLHGNVRPEDESENANGDRQPRDRSPQLYAHATEQLRRNSTACRWDTADGPTSDGEAQKSQRPITSAARSSDVGSVTPSDTEADDDSPSYLRALPAPTLRPRKGLRPLGDETRTQDSTPFLTPSQLDDAPKQADYGYFNDSEKDLARKADDGQAKKAREKFTRRRRAELGRRFSEIFSLLMLYVAVSSNERSWVYAKLCWNELRNYVSLIVILITCFPIRAMVGPLVRGSARFDRLRIPAAFDPAPLLYPPTLPILVSLSLSKMEPSALMLNIVLSLSTLPRQLMPLTNPYDAYYMIHWTITLLPLSASAHIKFNGSSDFLMHVTELPVFLYPLHQALLPTLYYLTTSSLLSAELQLLSVSLINLLLQATTPQTSILRCLLWIGGLGLFLLCRHAVTEIVALERIPSWRFQKAERVISASHAFSSGTTKSLQQRFRHNSLDAGTALPGEQERPGSRHQRSRTMLDSASANFADGAPLVSHALSSPRGPTLNRAQTSPSQPMNGDVKTQTADKPPLRARASHFSLKPGQVSTRKLLLTMYVYCAIVSLVLIPIRVGVSQALIGWEPFGWAIGYLFGDLDYVHLKVNEAGLSSWIPLPPRSDALSALSIHALTDINRHTIGLANTRLLIFAYWAITLSVGLLTILLILPYLSKRLHFTIEVDTRRKVFHFTTVALLFPTAFIDPPFLHLALSLVLAVFLLLDLLRASQLKPVSKPLARFLTPYIDGRDLRGPVIVSHMFLLVGCAIPFWLSLAGYPYEPPYKSSEASSTTTVGKSDPWAGWILRPTAAHTIRDVSMLAGVVCVGMGDAAASLIGRRYGRRKWPWAGGKSLEGSAAFAVAVTVGLVLGKVWLRLGGWEVSSSMPRESGWLSHGDWPLIVGKAALAGCGASFMEAVLTGANDNVVVPVILWLLVRGLDI